MSKSRKSDKFPLGRPTVVYAELEGDNELLIGQPLPPLVELTPGDPCRRTPEPSSAPLPPTQDPTT